MTKPLRPTRNAIKAGQKFLARRNATDETVGELFIYDQIGGGWFSDGVTPDGVRAALEDLKGVDRLDVFINSPGGDVFDGVAIYNLIKRFDAKTVVYVDGLAASIASIIAMAGDEIVMNFNSLMMIHDPWTWARGSAADLRETATLLDQIREVLISTYAVQTKTTTDKDEISAIMLAETWLDAATTVEKGFADRVEGGEVEEPEDDDDAVDARASAPHPLLNRWTNTPKALRTEEAPEAPTTKIKVEVEVPDGSAVIAARTAKIEGQLADLFARQTAAAAAQVNAAIPVVPAPEPAPEKPATEDVVAVTTPTPESEEDFMNLKDALKDLTPETLKAEAPELFDAVVATIEPVVGPAVEDTELKDALVAAKAETVALKELLAGAKAEKEAEVAAKVEAERQVEVGEAIDAFCDGKHAGVARRCYMREALVKDSTKTVEDIEPANAQFETVFADHLDSPDGPVDDKKKSQAAKDHEDPPAKAATPDGKNVVYDDTADVLGGLQVSATPKKKA